MKLGVIIPQGWTGDYDGWDAGDGLGRSVAAGPAGGRARLRVDLGVRPLPHRPAADRRDHLRVVHDAVRAGRRDEPGPARPHRHLHGVPQPGADGQDDLAPWTSSAAAGWSSGIGAGWKRDEWDAYGYGFPETRERLARLADDLEVVTRMMDGRPAPARDLRGHATRASRTRATCPSRSSSRASRSWSAATGPT